MQRASATRICLLTSWLLVATHCSSAWSAQPALSPEANNPEFNDEPEGGLLDLNLDQLSRQDVMVPSLSTPVTSVSRQESTVGRSAAAVFVITPEMIRRSGATSVAELLRMVPGLEVAKIDSNVWAIASRGFNDHFTSKLLVQIDGRVVYNPVFGGVYWDTTDVMLQDVDRIEVIRGPGTVVWGSNAMNGVINIFTKQAKDTQGALAVGGGGDQERDFEALRYGGHVGDDLFWRFYVKHFDRNRGYIPAGALDSWHQERIGFRADWTPTEQDTVTLQGDLYCGYSGKTNLDFATGGLYQDGSNVAGGDLLWRWTRNMDDDTQFQFQTYFDNYQRNSPTTYENVSTGDFDLQLRTMLNDRNQLVCGANGRFAGDALRGTPQAVVLPPHYSTTWGSLFFEDRYTLAEDRWYVIGGTRVEYNTFGHVQPQPTGRLLFLPDERHSCWGAVSLAARNPTRVEAGLDVNIPLGGVPPAVFTLNGDSNIRAEKVMTYEVGMRAAPTDNFSWDAAAFVSDYDHLITTTLGTPFFDSGVLHLPSAFGNTGAGTTTGFELTSTWEILDDWQLFGSYTYLEMNINAGPGGDSASFNGAVPHNQVYLRSSWDLAYNAEFDVIGRYVDNLSADGVSKYITMDLRLGWTPRQNLQLAVVGQNLLDQYHYEFIEQSDPLLVSTEVVRGVYGSLTWRW